MHHLEGGSQDGTAQVRLLDPKATSETILPASEPAGIGDNAALVFLVGDDLREFSLNVFGVGRLIADNAEGLPGFFDAALLDEIARRVREEYKSSSQNDCPDKLDCNRNAEGTGVLAFFGAVDQARRQHETDGDTELVASDNSTSNTLGALSKERQNVSMWLKMSSIRR